MVNLLVTGRDGTLNKENDIPINGELGQNRFDQFI